MSEFAQLHEPAAEPLPSDPIAGLAGANRRALDTALGTQGLVFEEIVFAANELLDRTQTETHLLAEFVSKLAGSHSMRDWAPCTGNAASISSTLYVAIAIVIFGTESECWQRLSAC
ncbi:hypothetical protein AB8Z38_36980 [Bradyrhizobium sp. LLZ17]|uniref:Uncharacterized protein n=1 Tax=Bradyrhizobium sp. LLZ17 TaxID=3239388 RepID=A0AB39XNR8_9BRAD